MYSLTKKNTSLLVALLTSCVLDGCAPVAFMGATTSVATSAAEERGLGGVISDTEIKARILSLYAESDLPLNRSVDVVVRQGHVLLSGVVENQKIRMEAVRLAWIARGVQEVHDEMSVGDAGGVGTAAKDTWISTQIKTKMLFNENISSINYNIHTIGSVVYLMGIAKNQQELDHVIDLARHTSGVQKVVNYVRVSGAYVDKSVPQNAHHTHNPTPQAADEPVHHQPSAQVHSSTPLGASAFD